ncbi:MAG: golvesin C-terminal-like domain-containing protein [Armatimonadota bacterium]
MNRFIISLMLLITLCIIADAPVSASENYPKIANLWGCPISTTEYDMWARYDMIVIGEAPLSMAQKLHDELKKRNPNIKILGTGPLTNLLSPVQTPWMKDEWYSRTPDGKMITWWADQIYFPNLFIDDCFNAILNRNIELHDVLMQKGLIDGIMFDSVVGRATWIGDIDTNLDGIADKPEDVDERWHAKQCEFFDALHKRWPGSLLLANDADDGHMPHINGRLFEGATLLDQMMDGAYNPINAIKVLDKRMTESAQPGITFALASHPIGWQGWRVGKGDKVTTPGEIDKVKRDFRRMRLGLTTTLMTDAYYYYDVGTIFYGTPKLWYAEYDAKLGSPVSAAKEVAKLPPITVLDWHAGQKSDLFRKESFMQESSGGLGADIKDKDASWSRVIAIDPDKLKLLAEKTYRIQAECEIIRKPDNILVFMLRTGASIMGENDKAREYYNPQNGKVWKIDTIATLDDISDYSAQWHMLGPGAVRLKSLKISQVGDSYYIREFENGMAIMNPTPRQITVKLDKPMRKIADKAAPLHYIEVDDSDAACTLKGAWERLAGEANYSGTGYRKALKIGATASWKITAPSTDVYTISACAPGGKDLTDSAEFSVKGLSGETATAINQRGNDGGWVKLFDVHLTKGQKIEIALRSSGIGATAADAIRAESKALFNDGSSVKSVVIDPLDGILLLR